MNRLLGGVRMKWANTAAKKWLAGFGGVLTLATLAVSFAAPHAAFAATCPVVINAANNTPSCIRWVNREYLVDNNGNNYLDNNTYDNVFDYVEQGTRNAGECANHIDFSEDTSSNLDGGDQINDHFFYDVTNDDFAYKNTVSGKKGNWTVTVQTCTLSASGGVVQQQQLHTVPNVPIDDNGGARRVTFYIDSDGVFWNIPGGVTFTLKGKYVGSDVYANDNEVADSSNPCPDILVIHPAQPTGDGRALFGNGGSGGDIPGSAMLYAVTTDASNKGIAESYNRIAALDPTVGQGNNCHIAAGDVNAKFNGIYGIFYHSTHGADLTFQAGGLDKNGNTVKGGPSGGPDANEGDDSFIVFVGTQTANWIVDPATNAPAPTPTPSAGGTGGGSGQPGITCNGGGLGYFICAVITGIQDGIKWIAQVLKAFLVVNPLTIGSGALYDSWNNIRNVANIAFVLAFFAIILSQATSIGISNYGIKRLLPRLIAVAIATNLSYILCSFMVDVFNVLGAGVAGLFEAVGGAGVTIDINGVDGAFFTGGIGLGVIWAIHSGIIVQLFPLILAGALGLLITFLLLIARQIIIILLVVVSPLALVAALLPGTQSWFKRWITMLSSLLVLYPLVMAMFAAAQLAQSILHATAGGP